MSKVLIGNGLTGQVLLHLVQEVELFAESFFKLPLMRRLEDDMSRIELSEVRHSAKNLACNRAETKG